MHLDDSILRLVIAGVWMFSGEFGGLCVSADAIL